MQNTIYDLTTEILNDFLNSAESYAEFNNNLGNKLLQVLETQKISVEENFDFIRKAIADFFYKNGLNAFALFLNHTLKITATIKNRNDNLYTHFLFIWIEKQNPKGLTPELFESILKYAKDNFEFDDNLLYRDVARGAIKKYFGLDSRDSLFFKDFDYVVKKFDYDFVQINKELRSIKQLDTSILLSENDKTFISNLLKHTDLKKLLILAAQETLEGKIYYTNVSAIELRKSFFDFVAQNLRVQVGKILGSQVSSLNQTCFVEEFIRGNKNLIIPILAKKILEIFHYHPDTISSLVLRFENKLRNNNPKLRTSTLKSQNVYTLEMIQTISAEFFSIQEEIYALKQELKTLDSDTTKKDEEIQALQDDIKAKKAILQKINATYEHKKESLKDSSLSVVEQEALNISLSNFINEQKLILEDLENEQKKVDEINNEKNLINDKKKDLQQKIQQTHFKSQNQERNFDLLAQSFGEALLQNEI